MAERGGARWLLANLALQNLGRRKARSFLLMAAVAIASGSLFLGATVMRSIQDSMEMGFTRLGADLMVVPDEALTNITAALLVVEPGPLTLPAGLLDQAALAGIARSAPQRVFRTAEAGLGGHHEEVDLIGFDPARDFSVLPWLEERLARPPQPGDIIVGARRDLPLGSEVLLFGQPHRVYGKLGASGVGPHERGFFLTSASLLALGPAVEQATGSLPEALRPDRVTGFLIELAPGTSELQLRFALLSKLTGIKVVAGESLLTSIRQGLEALLDGILALVALLFCSTVMMVALIFSAIIAERRQELGLLKAIGARHRQIVGLLLAEAVVATAAGGLAGVALGYLLLRIIERALVGYLEGVGLPFLWLDGTSTALLAAACVLLAATVGAVGALWPAWRASRREPYALIHGGG